MGGRLTASTAEAALGHLAVIRPRGFLCMVKTLVNLSLGMVLQERLICEIVLAQAI